MAEELQVNFREHREPASFVLAVDIDGDESPGCLIHLRKDTVHTGRLAGSWQATEDSVQWPGSVETRTQREGQFTELGLPVFELVGDMVNFKDVPVPEEGLVRHEVLVFHELIVRDWIYKGKIRVG